MIDISHKLTDNVGEYIVVILSEMDGAAKTLDLPFLSLAPPPEISLFNISMALTRPGRQSTLISDCVFRLLIGSSPRWGTKNYSQPVYRLGYSFEVSALDFLFNIRHIVINYL